MDPILMQYLHNLSDLEQAKNQEVDQSPILNGTQSAIQAANNSLEMDRQQQQRAFGHAMLALGSNMSRPGYGSGLGGTLAALNASIMPAVNAYTTEEQRIAQRNAYLQDKAIKQREMQERVALNMLELQQREKEQEELRKHREAQFAEQKAYRNKYLNLHEKQLQRKLDEIHPEQQEQISSSKGAVPLSSLPKKFRENFETTASEYVKNVPFNHRALEAIAEMKTIFEQYPDIGTSFLHVINDENDVSWRNQIMRELSDPNKLAAVDILKKLSADLNLDVIMGQKGRNTTDMLKKAIQQAAPHGKLTTKGFEKISDIWEKRAQDNIRKANVYEKAIIGNYYPMLDENDKIQHEESKSNTENSNPYDLSDLGVKE
jgi:hypothetical protein